ncbi:DUF4150 domain-containing protein [Xenorhabdus griffiniae]|nr:DUF4150 domain-containing protein [Xenorhabdus griffiniae]MBE8587651.1 DUF4150 domain-containing protein [Xenorhabdus griffiniae]
MTSRRQTVSEKEKKPLTILQEGKTRLEQGQEAITKQAKTLLADASGIPYPVVAKLADSSAPEKTVRTNGKPVVVFAHSFVPTTLGDQPSVANGVKSGTVGGKCHPQEHTKTVRAGNKLVLRHGDKFWMNGE